MNLSLHYYQLIIITNYQMHIHCTITPQAYSTWDHGTDCPPGWLLDAKTNSQEETRQGRGHQRHRTPTYRGRYRNHPTTCSKEDKDYSVSYVGNGHRRPIQICRGNRLQANKSAATPRQTSTTCTTTYHNQPRIDWSRHCHQHLHYTATSATPEATHRPVRQGLVPPQRV